MNRPPPNTIDNETRYRAWAKAKILTKGMRECAREGIDPLAQALFAQILAEAWPDERYRFCWSARLSMRELERRLQRTRNTIRGAIAQLESIELIRTVTGNARRTSRFVIPIYETSEPTASNEASRECVHAPPGGEPTVLEGVSRLTPKTR